MGWGGGPIWYVFTGSKISSSPPCSFTSLAVNNRCWLRAVLGNEPSLVILSRNPKYNKHNMQFIQTNLRGNQQILEVADRTWEERANSMHSTAVAWRNTADGQDGKSIMPKPPRYTPASPFTPFFKQGPRGGCILARNPRLRCFWGTRLQVCLPEERDSPGCKTEMCRSRVNWMPIYAPPER